MIRLLAWGMLGFVTWSLAHPLVAQDQIDNATEPVSEEVLEQERKIKIAIKDFGGEVTEEDDRVVTIRLGRGELLESPSMKDAAELIRSFRDLAQLHRLVLYHTWTQDEILAEVSQLAQLEQLVLWDFGDVPSNDGIAQVKDMPNLNYLYITNINRMGPGHDAVRVTGEVLQTLGQMDQLEQLFLTAVPVSDEHLEHLSDMTQLTTLQLGIGPNEITAEGLSHLSGLTNLRRLGVQQANLAEDAFDQLAFLTGLEDLMLTNADEQASFGDAAFDYLLEHEQLKRIYIGPTTISIEQIRRLLESREFERFMLHNDALAAEEINALLDDYPDQKIWINNIRRADQ